MEYLKPNDQRAKNAILLIWIILGIDVVSVISSYFQYLLLKDIANGEEVSQLAASANDLRERIVGIVYIIVFIISIVTFIQWFRRAYFNLHVKVEGLSFPENWAAGCWFVPIIGWYRPYQIMKELYVETKALLYDKGLINNDKPTNDTLGWWWALWIIVNLIGKFVFRYALHADSVNELITVTIASLTESLLDIPLAIITVKVIKGYSNIESLLFQVNEEEETPGDAENRVIDISE